MECRVERAECKQVNLLILSKCCKSTKPSIGKPPELHGTQDAPAWLGASHNSDVGGAQETTERRLERADCRQEGGNLFMSECLQISNDVKHWQAVPSCTAQGRGSRLGTPHWSVVRNS